MATRKSLTAAIVCVGTMAGLAGCSQDGDVRAGSAAGNRKEPVAATSAATAGPFKGLSADRIADKAVAATKGADSLRMAGAIESDGDPVTVDLAMDSQDNCTGDLGVKGGRAELRRLSDVIYLKGDGAFWRATMDERASASPDGGGDGVVELMTDRWIKMPGSAIDDMRGVCDLDAMLSELDDGEKPTGMTLGKDAEVDGVPAAVLVKKEGRETTTAYVTKEGRPYLLKVVRAGGDDAGTVAFSDFDKPVRVQAPPSDEVVDLEKLGGETGADPSDGASADSDSDSGTGTGPSTEPSSPPGGDDAGTVAFSDFDKPVRVQAPPSDEVVDLEKLGGETGADPSDGASADSDSDSGTGTGPSTEPSSPPSSSPSAEEVPEDGDETGFGAGSEQDGSGTS
ncbi:hypothetical protein [Streptomyces sp. t39]|uniref:hypothetical protein n=1 Tax=Streptomyces sp. t39 TaxID=1828156 RepID=UPI001650A5B3|nr:hypothetical protein [Streptomyces sp. t39]